MLGLRRQFGTAVSEVVMRKRKSFFVFQLLAASFLFLMLCGCGAGIHGLFNWLNSREDEKVTPAAVVNSPPGVSIAPVSGEQSGEVVVTYKLFDGDSDVLMVLIHYSLDAGTSFTTATESLNPLSEGMTGLGASPGGTTHVFIWDSLSDMAGVASDLVEIRITPYDAEEGTPATTPTFSVDNNEVPLLGVTTPVGLQVGNVSLSYILTDAESDGIAISVEYSIDNWATSHSATKASGGDPITGLTSSSTGIAHTFIWDSLSDLGYSLNNTVQIRITPSDTEEGALDTTGDFAVDNNEAPIASVMTPSVEQSGTFAIAYALFDSNSDIVDVEIKYSINSGATWSSGLATEVVGPPSEGTSGLASSPSGTSHIFMWNSLADIGQIYSDKVRIRITPSDFVQGSPGSSDDFSVSNNAAPSVFVLTPSGLQSDDITISYVLVEPENESCDISVYYSEDAGATWNPAIMGSGGDGTAGLVGSPGGANFEYAWDSALNVKAPVAHQDDIRIRIVPTDPYRDGAYGQTGDFEVDNTIPPSVSITNPGSPKSANVSIDYLLYDADSEFCSVIVEFTTGAVWLAAAQSGGDPTTGLDSSPGGTAHTFVWDTIADGVGTIGLESASFRILPSDLKTGTSALVGFDVNNAGDVPWAEVDTPAVEQSGSMNLSYTLYDPTSDLCDAYVQYSTDGGASWHDAAGSPSTSLSSSPTGVSHSFIWDSVSDIGQVYNAGVKLRVRPHDGSEWGDWIATGSFAVNNNDAPDVIVVTPVVTQSGTVLISYTFSDTESDLCDIYVEYSENGGGSYSGPATPGPGGEGVSGLISSSGGTAHIYSWNSIADIGATWQTDIRIRITPADAYRSGAPDATGDFEVNNTNSSIWTGAEDTDWFNPSNWDGGTPSSTRDVFVPAGAPRYPVIINDSSAKSLIIENAAQVTLQSNKELSVENDVIIGGTFIFDSLADNRGVLTVAGNLSLGSTGRITADGTGYGPGSGDSPGGNGVVGRAGGGGGHGGYGGYGETSVVGGSPYGSVREPIAAGSGGGSGSNGAGPGGAGGGIIRINVTGTFLLDGVVSANGEDGLEGSSNAGGGGGAGGSIWVSCATLAGSGRFEANGGDGKGKNFIGGGGAGGRIAVYYSDASGFSGQAISIASPGAGFAEGAADYGFGSIILVDDNDDLSIFTDTLFNASNYTFNDITIFSGATFALDSYAAGEKKIKVSAQGNFVIEAGAIVTGSYLGFRNHNGDGPGENSGSNSQGGGGAGYGGDGGDGEASPDSGGDAYGDPTKADKLGSGGGDAYDASGTTDIRGGFGGGCMELNVTSTITINGIIYSDGQDGHRDDAGGGSGGGIKVKAPVITGSGFIYSRGGNGLDSGGGGGGGRVRLETSTDTFTGTINVSGGTGFNNGADGTIVRP